MTRLYATLISFILEALKLRDSRQYWRSDDADLPQQYSGGYPEDGRHTNNTIGLSFR
jgi:hypothetical protein